MLVTAADPDTGVTLTLPAGTFPWIAATVIARGVPILTWDSDYDMPGVKSAPDLTS
jgi:hypothetical protein